MAETDDAYTLVSSYNSRIEQYYADYANGMKALANSARKTMVNEGKIKYSASAKNTYQKEVDHLMAQLNVAEKNAPRERQAQVIANSVVAAKKKSNPDMTKKEVKKASQQALTAARNKVGAKRTSITISDREWDAIQAGAISENQLTKIIRYADMDSLRQKATPRSTSTISTTKANKIKSMYASGNYTTAEIAASIGVSSSTINKYLSGKED